MKKTIQILAALLLAQLALAAFLLTRSEPTAAFVGKDPLLSVTGDTLDRLLIEEKDGDKVKSLELVKKDATWILPSQQDFPASSTKVREFLTAVSAFKKSWPVGSTDIAAKQFKVVEGSFERRLSFFSGDKKPQVLYLGSSPSFKKVHARVDGDTSTYAVDFSTFEVTSGYKTWMDKAYLDLDRAKVKEVTIGDLGLENQSGDFLVKGLAESEETNKSKTNALMAHVLNPKIEDVLGKKDVVEHGSEAFTYQVQMENGDALTYTFYEEKAKEEPAAQKAADASSTPAKAPSANLVLVTSKDPYAFLVSRNRITELLQAQKAELVKVKGSESPAATPEGGLEEGKQGASGPTSGATTGQIDLPGSEEGEEGEDEVELSSAEYGDEG